MAERSPGTSSSDDEDEVTNQHFAQLENATDQVDITCATYLLTNGLKLFSNYAK